MRDAADAIIAHHAEPDIAASSRDGRDALDFIPVCSGPRLATFRGGAVHLDRPAGSMAFVAESHYATVFLSPLLGALSAVGSSKLRVFDAPVGMLGIVPAGVDGSTIWPMARESVSIAITPASLLELAEHELDAGGVDLQALNSVVVDPTAHRIAELLKAELRDKPAANELYVDSLITLFGVHLLRNYSGIDRPQSPIRGGLSPHNARRVRDYLVEHLSDKLSIAELAALCGLSPSHFIKAFAQTFGQRPYQYLTNLRLDHAVRLLEEQGMTIAEIAHLSGFSSQSHLTSTLRKHRGLTPAQLRRRS